jgi:hypothetical protein
MQQANVIEFPLVRQLETDRIRLYRDEPSTIVLLSAVRATVGSSYFAKSSSSKRSSTVSNR